MTLDAGKEAPEVPPADPAEALPRMSLGDHLNELRSRLVKSALAIVVGMAVAFFFYKEIWQFAVSPYEDAAAALGIPGQLLALGPGEVFLKSMWLCFLAGLILVSPFVLWQMWGFISAGLYPHEKRFVRIFFPVSIVLFLMGCSFAYVVVLPVGMQFLLAFSRALDVQATFGVGPYLDMFTVFLWALGLCFELPLVMLFVQAVGLVHRKTLVKGWRLAVVIAFIIAMVATPDPSPVSQILLAFPLVGLYFLGIWSGRFVGENKIPFTAWRAWPLVLVLGSMAGLLLFAGRIAAWGASLWR